MRSVQRQMGIDVLLLAGAERNLACLLEERHWDVIWREREPTHCFGNPHTWAGRAVIGSWVSQIQALERYFLDLLWIRARRELNRRANPSTAID